MKLYVRFMVSLKCKMLIKADLKKIGINYAVVELGVIDILEDITTEQLEKLKTKLLKSGFELLDKERANLINKIKEAIKEMINESIETLEENYVEYITKKVGHDYKFISELFAEVKGITIEQFILTSKIEKAKELILYDEAKIKEVSEKLNYKNVSKLSNQFKKVTGLTPKYYKEIKKKRKKITKIL